MQVQEKTRVVEKNWSDETGARSYIEGLDFSGDRVWEKCEVLVHGHKDKNTGCQLSVLVDGESRGDYKYVLHGTEQRPLVVPIGKKARVDVVGYITNHGLVTGGGADIVVKCFPQE